MQNNSLAAQFHCVFGILTRGLIRDHHRCSAEEVAEGCEEFREIFSCNFVVVYPMELIY